MQFFVGSDLLMEILDPDVRFDIYSVQFNNEISFLGNDCIDLKRDLVSLDELLTIH